MSRKVLAVLVAIVATAAVVFMVSSMITKPILPEVNQTNIEQEVINSDKPVVLLVTSRSCGNCTTVAEAFKAQAEKTPGVKFMQIQGAAVGAPDGALPAVMVLLPGVGQPIYQKANYALPSDLDAFVAKLLEVEALRQKQVSVQKPFDDQMADIEARAQAALAPIQAELEAALKPFEEEAKAIQERAEQALGTLPEELNNAKTPEEFIRIQTEIMQKVAPFEKELDDVRTRAGEATKDIRARAAETVKPFQEEAVAVQEKLVEALGTLPDEIRKAVGELNQR